MFPTKGLGVVYGISLFAWQQSSAENHGFKQTAIVVLSRAPFFGHIRKRLLPIARVCLFDGGGGGNSAGENGNSGGDSSAKASNHEKNTIVVNTKEKHAHVVEVLKEWYDFITKGVLPEQMKRTANPWKEI